MKVKNMEQLFKFDFDKEQITFHPSGLQSISVSGIPVSKSVQQTVPSDDDV